MESVVKRLLQIGSDEFVREILGVFLSEVPRRIDAIRTGLRSDSPGGVAFAAHALRGSCGNLGADEAESLCGVIEERAGLGRLDGLLETTDRLEASLDRFCADLREEHRALLDDA
jgi:HPt (histidine-containing phosphotransfer) domain-containing protein